MTKKDAIKRKDFLMQMGFKGGALMALLSSCVHPEDTYVAARTIDPNDPNAAINNATTPTPGGRPPKGGKGPRNQNNGTGNNNTGTEVSSKILTTTELNAITGVKLKLDLTANANKNLGNIGGYIINSKIVVALAAKDNYVAATLRCSHEPEDKIKWQSNEWYCTEHGARFNTKGVGQNSVANKGLAVYNVATDGKTLVVY